MLVQNSQSGSRTGSTIFLFLASGTRNSTSVVCNIYAEHIVLNPDVYIQQRLIFRLFHSHKSMFQSILYRNLDNHRRQHELHIHILGNMELRHRKERIGFMAKSRIARHHLQFLFQTYRHLIARKQVGTQYLYQELKRFDINPFGRLDTKILSTLNTK